MFIRMELDPGETSDLFHLNTRDVKDVTGVLRRTGRVTGAEVKFKQQTRGKRLQKL